MTKRLLAKVDTYQKDGENKNKYAELGVILSGQNGEYMLLDPSVSLAGVLAKQNALAMKNNQQQRDSVMVSIFDGQQNNGGSYQNQGQQSQGGYQNQGQQQQGSYQAPAQQQGGYQQANQRAQGQQNQGGQQQGGYNQGQQGGYQQSGQQNQNVNQGQQKINPQEPDMDFDDDIPF